MRPFSMRFCRNRFPCAAVHRNPSVFFATVRVSCPRPDKPVSGDPVLHLSSAQAFSKDGTAGSHSPHSTSTRMLRVVTCPPLLVHRSRRQPDRTWVHEEALFEMQFDLPGGQRAVGAAAAGRPSPAFVRRQAGRLVHPHVLDTYPRGRKVAILALLAYRVFNNLLSRRRLYGYEPRRPRQSKALTQPPLGRLSCFQGYDKESWSSQGSSQGRRFSRLRAAPSNPPKRERSTRTEPMFHGT